MKKFYIVMFGAILLVVGMAFTPGCETGGTSRNGIYIAIEPKFDGEYACWSCMYSGEPMKCVDMDMDKIHGHHHPFCYELNVQHFTRSECCK